MTGSSVPPRPGGPGPKIGRYELESEAARGGMGEVFAAYDPRMRRRVAIKLLRADLCAEATARARFEREAVAAARLEHPCIVPVYDFGEHEGRAYLVMRWLGGGSLAQRLAGGRLGLRDAAPILQRMAQALDAAHELGVIHRDVKPANILFDDDGEAHLSDFGVASITLDEDAAGDRRIVGTPRYMSPEQAQGFPLDGRSDVYALGLVAYHMLAGGPPFDGDTAMALAFAHAMRSAKPITDHLPELDPVANKVFLRVLAKRPEDRYPSAGAFAKDFGELAAGRWYLLKLSEDLRAVAHDGAFAGEDFSPRPGNISDETGAYDVDQTDIWGDDTPGD